ncbi:hypothetical protein [Gordonia soli]|uniref:Uncharacterized protein n=1 Tax=Gordonia soli NBRC 108243 TaxID=1223545 RepID=M0QJX1_9ACTN|nr:hypothetical protein [Gordonia soli]GAC68586.1 hypothetical protein GS4_16_01170 [Gordonia soli NBRC 108243]
MDYDEPIRIDDDRTVIPVSRATWRGRSVAVGIFTVTPTGTTWTPSPDSGRVAIIGVMTGLIAATLGSAAVYKQPPWPKLTLTEHR